MQAIQCSCHLTNTKVIKEYRGSLLRINYGLKISSAFKYQISTIIDNKIKEGKKTIGLNSHLT
jgi:hypothetical protein